MIELTPERYAVMAIAEDKYYCLCEVLRDRTWSGLSGSDIVLIMAALGIEGKEGAV